METFLLIAISTCFSTCVGCSITSSLISAFTEAKLEKMRDSLKLSFINNYNIPDDIDDNELNNIFTSCSLEALNNVKNYESLNNKTIFEIIDSYNKKTTIYDDIFDCDKTFEEMLSLYNITKKQKKKSRKITR